MISMSFMISFLVFTSVLLFIVGIYSYRNYAKGKKEVLEKIKSASLRPALEELSALSLPREKGLKGRLQTFVGYLGGPIKPEREEAISNIHNTLAQAGYRRVNAYSIYFGSKVLFAVLLPLIFINLKIFFIKLFPPLNIMPVLVALALAGFYLPNLWIKLRIAERKSKLFEGFPDALDLMVICVEAGMGLDAAITRVGEEMKIRNKLISDEFRLMSLELRAGKPRREALRNMAVRTDLDEIRNLMSLLIQTDKFGTSVAQALRVHSDSMRTKRYQKAEEQAAKLPVKLLFPLIFFIFPTILVVIAGPAVVKIYRVLLPLLGK